MDNRTSRLTGSGPTNDYQPDQGPNSNRWAGTQERAGHGAPGPERHTGPRANRFQRINRLGGSLLPPQLFELVFSAIAIQHSAFRAILAFE